MKGLTDIERGKFALLDKLKPVILDPRDAVVQVILGSIAEVLWALLLFSSGLKIF